MIEIQETPRFVEWLEKLDDAQVKTRILTRIHRLSLGLPGDVRPVGEGVSELRIDYGSGYRIYFTRVRNSFVMLAGGDKRTQDRDIRDAIKLARGL